MLEPRHLRVRVCGARTFCSNVFQICVDRDVRLQIGLNHHDPISVGSSTRRARIARSALGSDISESLIKLGLARWSGNHAAGGALPPLCAHTCGASKARLRRYGRVLVHVARSTRCVAPETSGWAVIGARCGAGKRSVGPWRAFETVGGVIVARAGSILANNAVNAIGGSVAARGSDILASNTVNARRATRGVGVRASLTRNTVGSRRCSCGVDILTNRAASALRAACGSDILADRTVNA
jgi:hypothetical protein